MHARAFDSRTFDAVRTMDAASGSSFAFLIGQLELIEPNVVKPLQAVTHPRDIAVKNGGGFPEFVSAWALDYGDSGGGPYGLQATNNTELPEAQGNIKKGQWPVIPWGGSFTISVVDLKRMETATKIGGAPPPVTLQQLYEQSIETTWVKALDWNCYTGFNGYPGLINNPNVPAFVVPSGGSGTQWATKTPTQIFNDINAAINVTVINSGYDPAGCADSMLVPYPQFALLTQPVTIGGVGYDSLLTYIKRNCVAVHYGVPEFKINPLPNPWISGKGIGGLDRALFYRNNEECVQMNVPQPKTLAYTIPTQRVAYSSYFVGAIANVMFKRTITMCYADGI